MGLFDRFKRKPLEQDGRTAATAILLPAVDGAAAVAIRYEVLARLFGVRDLDWQVLQRSWLKGPGGRALERYDIGTRQGRDVVFFDVGDVAEDAGILAARAALSRAVATRNEADLTIELPKDQYLTLWKMIEEVADRFASDDFAYDFARVSVLQAMAAHDLRSEAPLPVTLRVMDWAGLRFIAGTIESAEAQAQQRIEGLVHCLDEGLSRAGGEETRGAS